MKPFVLTVGDPASIGPDLIIKLCFKFSSIPWFVLSPPELLEERANLLKKKISLIPFSEKIPMLCKPGTIYFQSLNLPVPSIPGKLNIQNVPFVIESLQQASLLCKKNIAVGMVTGPVQKSLIQESGISFTGQTEFLAKLSEVSKTVMMLMGPHFKVALLTTHIPLREVPSKITHQNLVETLRILHQEMKVKFGILSPKILVCGLNPHAGENGGCGREEIEIMIPALEQLKREGLNLMGPVSADTAFTKDRLTGIDVILAMYHDQGLPVLKYASFGKAINITLGLPFIRTSVDHGTALNLAGTGKAKVSSLMMALKTAHEISQLLYDKL